MKKTKEKIIASILVGIFLISTIYMNFSFVNAENGASDSNTDIQLEENQYKLRLITSEEEITSDSGNDYIIVSEENGVKYALSSTVKTDSPLFAMGLDNAEEVEIENDILTYSGENNIFWTFTKSRNTVAEGEDKPAIESVISVYSGDDETRKQLQFGTTNTQRNPAGMEYTNNGDSFNFNFYNDGTVRIQQNNGNDKYSYLRFLTTDKRFLSSKQGNSARVKIYEVVKSYTPRGEYMISDIESDPAYPNPGAVSINKTATVDENFNENGVASVQLDNISTPIKKDTDVVLVLDDSNSVYETINEDSETKKVDIIKNTASEFAEKILELNSNNRIAVVKFAEAITDEEKTDELGLSNNIEQIQELINQEKTNFDGGTNYTIAFQKANEILETAAPENRDSVVIFISDGAPSIYNRIKYTVYKDTPDGEVGHHADNWVNYFLNTNLKENELMKQAGTKIYTIGSNTSDKAITSTGAFVVNSEDTQQLLRNLSTGKSYFYNWDNMPTELENIYNDIFRDFYMYPDNAKVSDTLGDNFILLNKTVNEVVPKIQVTHGEDVIEEITFNEDGTEAYSTLKPEQNIMTIDENLQYTIEGQYVTYTSIDKTFKWSIGEIDSSTYSLKYQVYLLNSAGMFYDRDDLESGTYQTNKEAHLEYTNHMDEQITKDYPIPEISWEKQQDEVQDVVEDNKQDEDKKEDESKAEVVKTGDTIMFSVIMLIVLILILINIRIKKITVKRIEEEKNK